MGVTPEQPKGGSGPQPLPIRPRLLHRSPLQREPTMQHRLAAALEGLMADGIYQALLAKWRLFDDGIEKATVNAGR